MSGDVTNLFGPVGAGRPFRGFLGVVEVRLAGRWIGQDRSGGV